MNENESHEKQFKGWFIPVHVVELFESKIINAKELILLATIDGLSRLGQGCFASNKYLGDKVGISESRSRAMISHMKELKLIQQIKFDGRHRWLETYWSKHPNGSKQADCLKVSRQPAQKQAGCLSKSRQSETTPNSDQTPTKQGKNRDSKSLYKKDIRKDIGKDSMSGPKSPDDDSFNSVPKKKKSKPTAWDQRAASELAKVVGSHIKINCNAKLSVWANQFRIMREIDEVPKSVIKNTIKWYKENIGGEYIPEAFSARAFREKYKDGKFTSAMGRDNNEQQGMDAEDKQEAIYYKVRCWLEEHDPDGELDFLNGGVVDQDEVEVALKALGMKPGSVLENEL